MSFWTYVHGTITVCPMGRTQAEKRYILETVLEHLPIVSGSEEDMNIYIIQKNGYNSLSSVDEFGESTNNLKDSYGRKGWLETQNEYILVADGALRDRMFEDTFLEFQKWLCRLAKRIGVENIQVKIKGYEKEVFITDSRPYENMFEDASWVNKNSENWCEYLMWEYPRNEEGNLLLGKPSIKENL